MTSTETLLSLYYHYGEREFTPRCTLEEYLRVISKDCCRELWNTGKHLPFVLLGGSLDPS